MVRPQDIVLTEYRNAARAFQAATVEINRIANQAPRISIEDLTDSARRLEYHREFRAHMALLNRMDRHLQKNQERLRKPDQPL